MGGRDLRNSNNNYPDRLYYYPSSVINGNKLVAETLPLGRFNANDVIPFGWQPLVINGNVTSNFEYKGTIETIDEISDLRPKMFVKYADGNQWFIVDKIIESEVSDKSISARPSFKRTITLRGIKL